MNYLGVSEVSVTTLRRAHAMHPIAAVRVEYSLIVLGMDMEDKELALIKTARELGVIEHHSRENFPNIVELTSGLVEFTNCKKMQPSAR